MYGNAFIFPGTLADEIKHQHFKNVYPKGITRTRTALDSLMSVERKEAERNEVSSDLFSETDDDGNKEGKAHTSDGNATDSSGNGTRFKLHTGVFSVDFPPSPKVPKGKGKKSKPTARQQLELSGAESDVTTVMPTQTQDLTVSGPPSGTSDSDIVIQPSGFITSRRKRKRSTSNKSRSSDVRHRDCQDRVQATEVTKKPKRGKVHICRKEMLYYRVFCRHYINVSLQVLVASLHHTLVALQWATQQMTQIPMLLSAKPQRNQLSIMHLVTPKQADITDLHTVRNYLTAGRKLLLGAATGFNK